MSATSWWWFALKTDESSSFSIHVAPQGMELPPDMHCSHLCHNSLCINVNHLILETPFVNGNRRQCARENICLGHDQAPPCIFF